MEVSPVLGFGGIRDEFSGVRVGPLSERRLASRICSDDLHRVFGGDLVSLGLELRDIDRGAVTCLLYTSDAADE